MCWHHLTIPVAAVAFNRAISNVTVRYDSHGLNRLSFNTNPSSITHEPGCAGYPYVDRFITLFLAYLDGRPVAFDTVPVNLPSTVTTFQRTVWSEVSRIAYGTIVTYSQLAERVSGRSYARAVGQALHANPVPIIIPCHRVVAADGSLGGFRPGSDIKQALLMHEGASW